MAIANQLIEQLFEFQAGFSTTIKQLQEQAKNYNNCYKEAYEEIMNHYQQQQTNMIKSDQINNQKEQQLNQNLKSIQSSLNNHFNKLSEQYEIFNQNILQYYFKKFEFDKFYQNSQLEKMVEKQNRRYFNINFQELSHLNFNLMNQITSQQQQLVQKQILQFSKNEQYNNFISQTTYVVQELIKIRERKEKEIKDKIEENNKQQEDIRRQQEELKKNSISDTINENQENENNNDDDNLSEAEELTQLCQECGQQIKFNHFLTKCLHYYHEECIIQKIQANCNQTNIFCTCNSLINSRMIKDALIHQQQNQNSFTFENFLQNQVYQLIRQCKKNYTNCQCGFIYISEIQEEIEKCVNCQ